MGLSLIMTQMRPLLDGLFIDFSSLERREIWAQLCFVAGASIEGVLNDLFKI